MSRFDRGRLTDLQRYFPCHFSLSTVYFNPFSALCAMGVSIFKKRYFRISIYQRWKERKSLYETTWFWSPPTTKGKRNLHNLSKTPLGCGTDRFKWQIYSLFKANFKLNPSDRTDENKTLRKIKEEEFQWSQLYMYTSLNRSTKRTARWHTYVIYV